MLLISARRPVALYPPQGLKYVYSILGQRLLIDSFFHLCDLLWNLSTGVDALLALGNRR